jgi:hypothetical protein
MITLVNLNRGSWAGSIEAPAIDGFPRGDFSFDRFVDELKYLRAIIEREGKIFHVRSDYGAGNYGR